MQCDEVDMKEGVKKYDVAVIGAGVIGSMIARALSMRAVSVCLIEAKADVAAGASRANSGIVHAGYDAMPGSLKAKMNIRGNEMMEKTAEDLAVPYSNCGSLVVAFDRDEEQRLRELKARGEQNGVKTRILKPRQIRRMEPALSSKITAALYAKTAGIVCPFTLTIAAAENAVANGAHALLGREVTAIGKNR